MKKHPAITVAFAVVSGVAGCFTGMRTADSPARLSPERHSPLEAGTPSAASLETPPSSALLPDPPDFDPLNPDDFYEALARDPRLIAAGEYPEEALSSERFFRLLCQWIARDPRSAGDWIARQSPGWQALFAGMTPQECLFPDTTFAMLQRLPLSARPGMAFMLIPQLPCDPATLQAVLHSRPPLLSPDSLRNLRDAWSRSDGPAAMAEARHAGLSGQELQDVLTSASVRWPDEALKEAARLEGDDRQKALASILAKLADECPETALRYLKDHPGTSGTDHLATVALNALRESGLPFGDETTALFPDKWQPYVKIVSALARNDPAAAAAQWTSNMDRPDLERKNPVLKQIAQQYVLADPAAALSWSISLPGAMDRCRATSSVARAAVESDPGPLSVWLNTCPPSNDADRIIEVLLEQLSDDPAAAWAWATRLTSPERTAEHRSQILKDNPLFSPSSELTPAADSATPWPPQDPVDPTIP